jgi:multidrug transporter EmrE-like cation transporter
MQMLFEAARAMLNKALPSWTVWLGIAWAVMSGLPDLMTTVVGWFGDVTPELTAKVVAISLLIARARSIVQPVIEGLLGKSSST